MATVAEKAKQRIKFGKNGIKDGNGRVIRTDHMSLGDAISDMLDGTPSRLENMDKTIDEAVDPLAALKARQDKIAGNTRRT